MTKAIEEGSERDFRRADDRRVLYWKATMNSLSDLVFYGKFGYGDLLRMAVTEKDYHFERIKEKIKQRDSDETALYKALRSMVGRGRK